MYNFKEKLFNESCFSTWLRYAYTGYRYLHKHRIYWIFHLFYYYLAEKKIYLIKPFESFIRSMTLLLQHKHMWFTGHSYCLLNFKYFLLWQKFEQTQFRFLHLHIYVQNDFSSNIIIFIHCNNKRLHFAEATIEFQFLSSDSLLNFWKCKH